MPPCTWIPLMPPTPTYIQTLPYAANVPLCMCMFWGYLHVLGGCRGPSCVDTAMCLDASPCVQHPTCIYMLPYMSVCSRGHCMCYGGNIPYVENWGGFSTSVRLLVSVSISIGCPLCFILYLSCSSLCLKSTSTATSTTPPVTVVSSSMSSLSSVTMAPS